MRRVSCVKRGLRGGEHAVGGSTGVVVLFTYDGDMAGRVAKLLTDDAHADLDKGPTTVAVRDVTSYWADEVPGEAAVALLTDHAEGRVVGA